MTAVADIRKFGDRLAVELIRIEAVVFSPDKPFVWASGIESPVYCDNRLTMSYPAVRGLITDGFAAALLSARIQPDVIVGTATAGIPHAAWLANRLECPMAYVRSSKKSHGRENRVEGLITPGSTAVVVEDLVSTGGSSLDAIVAVREAGASTEIVLSIFSYELPVATQAFAAGGVRLFPLTTFSQLLHAAAGNGLLDQNVVEKMRDWHQGIQAEIARSVAR